MGIIFGIVAESRNCLLGSQAQAITNYYHNKLEEVLGLIVALKNLQFFEIKLRGSILFLFFFNSLGEKTTTFGLKRW